MSCVVPEEIRTKKKPDAYESIGLEARAAKGQGLLAVGKGQAA
jgi:hypothetical protein